MTKVFNIVSWVTLALFQFVLFLCIFWAVWPYRTLELKDTKFPVLTPKVKQGGKLVYQSKYCKYINLTATVSRSFINGVIFNTPSMITDRTVGCHTVTPLMNVPPELLPGKYRVQVIYIYEVNPIRTITIKHETEDFEVIPK